MARPIRMPTPGQMTEECTVLAWFKQEGDTVAKGEPLFEIETDKSNMEIEAFDEGSLLRIDAQVGETVLVDAVIAWIGDPGDALPEAGAETASAAAPIPAADTAGVDDAEAAVVPIESAAVAAEPTAATSEPATPSSEGLADQSRSRVAISPRASRVAAELGVDLRSVTGTGPRGRIVERDVRTAADKASASIAAAAIEPDTEPAPDTSAAAATPPPTNVSVAATAALPPQTGDGEPLSRIRKVIARRLVESVTTIPHYTVTVAVDMTALMRLRADLKAAGSGITVTDFIHSATVQSLGELPLVNARTDGQTLWRRDRVHLGIAVSIPDGLLVPVVRDADTLSISGLHDRTTVVVSAARAGTLGPDELSGSTFTVSNMGMYGVEQFTAIINPGESGILAVSSVNPEPVVIDGGIAIRQMMRLTLSADHRLVDGELGARFMNAVRNRLQDADTLRAQLTSA